MELKDSSDLYGRSFLIGLVAEMIILLSEYVIKARKSQTIANKSHFLLNYKLEFCSIININMGMENP